MMEGVLQAWQVEADMAIQLGSEQLELLEGKVVAAETMPESCVRLVTESNVTLVCSRSAPIWTSEGKYYDAPDLEGKQVAVWKDGKTYFDNIVEIQELEEMAVRPIDTGDNNFWAGELEGEYIMHHNMAFRLDSALFSVKKH
jgi:hypothetical protein